MLGAACAAGGLAHPGWGGAELELGARQAGSQCCCQVHADSQAVSAGAACLGAGEGAAGILCASRLQSSCCGSSAPPPAGKLSAASACSGGGACRDDARCVCWIQCAARYQGDNGGCSDCVHLLLLRRCAKAAVQGQVVRCSMGQHGMPVPDTSTGAACVRLQGLAHKAVGASCCQVWGTGVVVQVHLRCCDSARMALLGLQLLA